MVDNVDVVRDAKPMPQNAIDPSVVVPPSVKAAADRAAAIHAQAYPKPDIIADITLATVQDNVQPPAASAAPATDKTAAPPAPAPQPPAPLAPPPPPAPDGEDTPPDQWKHRFLSMKGRWEASQKQLGTMQEQMSQLGDELVRTQSLMQVPKQGQTQPPITSSLLTKEDIDNYGTDLIDLSKRAAMEAVKPALDALQQENANLKQRVTQNSQTGIYTALDRDVPNWREINTSARFREWVRLPDIYSGTVRVTLLNQAFAAANAPRVIAFFKGFIADEVAAGNVEDPPVPSAAAPLAPAPREAARTLESLTTPGKAKPATGDSSGPVHKPVFSRRDISAFYDAVRRGAYSGREAEKATLERQIFDAQRDNRVNG